MLPRTRGFEGMLAKQANKYFDRFDLSLLLSVLGMKPFENMSIEFIINNIIFLIIQIRR